MEGRFGISNKVVTLQAQMVLPLLYNEQGATELRWECSEILQHYPMLRVLFFTYGHHVTGQEHEEQTFL